MGTRRKDPVSEVAFSNEKLPLSETKYHFSMEQIIIFRKIALQCHNSGLKYEYQKKSGKGHFRNQKSESFREVKKKIDECIQGITSTELLPYLPGYIAGAHSFSQLIFYHVLANLEYPAREAVMKYKLKEESWDLSRLSFYFDLLFEDIHPDVCFDFIHKVWKYYPQTEFKLRLLCCKKGMENKHYDILDQLININKEYFLCSSKEFVGNIVDAVPYAILNETQLTVLILLLCIYVTSRQTTEIKTVLMLIEKMVHVSTIFPYLYTYQLYTKTILNVFMYLTQRKTQRRLTPSVIRELQPVLNRIEYEYFNLEMISICYESLIEVNCHQESVDFIKDNSNFIINVPLCLKKGQCEARQKHCILLLALLHVYMMSGDLTNMNRVLNRLQEFRKIQLSGDKESCYCFMGPTNCNEKPIIKQQYFETNIPWCNDDLYFINALNYKIVLSNMVIKGELKLAWFLVYIKEVLEKDISHRENALHEYMLLIEKLSVHNKTGLHDIIKTLCVLKMQPDIQDMFINGLTEYLYMKCRKQYNILSNLLLDINMTCKKGEFLKKLTNNVGLHLLSLEVNTSNDVENILYRCFCTVRHENKRNDNKDSNIEKYKRHFSFIATMESVEEMKKLTHLKSFLVMLILLIVLSGGIYKSAKLKKYLSLKYAYEDAILYLLWCSGDVEINPGPTLKKLRPQANSVKKRNWIHEMCTIYLKLLKNKALDSKTDGLWKENPDCWQELHADKPFYDPRNKPKSKQYSIKTDEELLNCLHKCCEGKNITLPSNFQREITVWKSDIKLLLELYVSRQEKDAVQMAKDLLITYRENPDFIQYMKDCNVDLSFNPNSTQEVSPKGYSDVVRDLANTFCRISKGLPIFEKNDGIWKTQPCDWNPNHLYYSPCNTGKRQEKHQDQKLVDNLLVYCERKSVSIPAELQLVANAWKLGNSQDICKHYTIWSSMAIIQHSLKYLEIEGLLEKPHVQQSLKQIGVSPHCEKSPNQHNNDSIINTDNESKVSGLPNNSLSANEIGTKSSSPLCSASDSNIVCSQHPYEADAITNSHTTKSVITCQKRDCMNQPSTSGCTIYSKTAPCQKRRVDIQSRYVRDLNDSHKSLSEISHQKHDFQPSSFGCSSFAKRAQCLMASDDLPSKDGRIQKRKGTISEDRFEKRSRLHLENESQASTSPITRYNGVTIPSSHCDSDILEQDVHGSNTEQEVDQDQSSNRIPVPDYIQTTDSSNTQLSSSGDEIPKHLLQYIDTYMSRDDLEKNLGEDLEQIDIQLKLWETS